MKNIVKWVKENVTFPKIWSSIKHSIKNFWYHSKYAKLDTAICIITLIVILYVAITGHTKSLWGAAGILLVYSYGVVIRLGNEVKERQRVQELLDKCIECNEEER